jgi:hypothetical protein
MSPLSAKETLSWFTAAILGAGLGLVFWGPNLIDPQNIAWLGGGLDPTQHYLGWVFYRNGQWGSPIGANPLYGMDIASSIVFTDSIPLLAFIFKFFNAQLPSTFQYLGLWTMGCFILQALIAYALAGLISSDRLTRLLMMGFFVASPAMLIRMGFQTGLASHFLILAALYLNLRTPTHRQSLAWFFLIAITALVHFYLLAMVLVLWFADGVRQIRASHISIRRFAFEALAIIFLLIFLFWQAGYLMLVGAVASGNQYGIGRLNLLSIFNPDGWSYLVPNLPLADRVYEGFIYLGLGLILCLMLALIGLRWHPVQWRVLLQRYPSLIVVCIGLTLFAISNQVGIGPWSFYIPLPDSVLALAGILRASGRLFWPVYYLLILGIFYLLTRTYSKKIATLILLCGLSIQIADTSAGWLQVRSKYMQAKTANWQTPLNNPFWKFAGERYDALVIIPAGNNRPQWDLWASYAAQNQMSTNSVFLARYNQTKLAAANAALNERLATGQYDPKSLYILESNKVIPALLHLDPQKDLLAKIDGFYVLAPGWQACQSCAKVPADQIVRLDTFMPTVGEVIGFGRDQSTKYLLNVSHGWAHPEAWGIWSDGGQAQLIIGIPQSGATSLTLSTRAFVTAKHPTQEIGMIINGEQRPNITLTKDSNNQITIPITKADQQAGYLNIEFQFKNPARPKALGLGDDDRLLSIGLEKAVFQ